MATIQTLDTLRDVSVDANNVQTTVVSRRVGAATHIYVFYVRTGTNDLVYKKSTDGGATFGSAVVIDSGETWGSCAVWFSSWTSGSSGTLIHIVASSVTNDNITYFSLDASTDTAGTNNDVVIISWTTLTPTTDGSLTICEATNGDIFAAGTGSVGPLGIQVAQSTNAGANWSDITGGGASDFNDDDDVFHLVPLIADDDVLLVGLDTSATELQFTVYDNVGNSWSAITSVESGPQGSPAYKDALGVTLDKTSGDVYILYVGGLHFTDNVDLKFRTFSESSRTMSSASTVVHSFATLLSIPDRTHKVGLCLARDQTDGTIMASLGCGNGTLLDVFPHLFLSSDTGATWSDPFLIPTVGKIDIRRTVMPMIMLDQNEGWYVAWMDGTTELFDGLLSTIALDFVSGTVFDDDASTAVSGADVTLEEVGPRLISSLQSAGQRPVHGHVQSDGSGNYKIAVLPRFSDEGGNPDYQAVVYDDQGGANDQMDLTREVQED